LRLPTVGLHVAALPPPSSSVNSTRLPSLLIVALCQNAKFVSSTLARTFGLTGLRMSKITPSPVHAPAARPIAWYTVMSWQPVVGRSVPVVPSLPPSGNRIGSFTMRAFAGLRFGTETTEILSCGFPHSNVPAGAPVAGR
jgi:hypothetical protein